MDSETKQLRSLISTWEKKRRHAERMVGLFRSALALHEKAAATIEVRPRRARGTRKSPSAAAPIPFAPKYQKTAKDFIMEILSVGKRMSLREISDILSERKIHFTDQAMSFSLQSLEKAGRVRKAKAPNGSPSRFVYEAVKGEKEDRRTAS